MDVDRGYRSILLEGPMGDVRRALERVPSRAMRIIAGEHRGRRLASPPGRGTRPMLDRVKEAVFSSLGEQVVDARVLDLFAGSGSLGLEALSRGAASVRFVETGRKALEALEENVATLGVEEHAELCAVDALGASAWRAPEEAEGGWADLVFLDPPYPMVEGAARAEVLAACEALVGEVIRAEGMVVFHAPKGALDAAEFADTLSANERTYGSTSIWYLG